MSPAAKKSLSECARRKKKSKKQRHRNMTGTVEKSNAQTQADEDRATFSEIRRGNHKAGTEADDKARQQDNTETEDVTKNNTMCTRRERAIDMRRNSG